MEKRKQLKLFKDLYGYTVGICLTDDIIKSSNEMDVALGGEGTFKKKCNAMHYYTEEDSLSIIYITLKSSNGAIAHEAWHCIRRMFEWNGQTFDNETVAYHISYLVDQIHKFINNGK